MEIPAPARLICGDGIVEGAEGCDDGNAMPFDGCGKDCQIEPVCSAGSSCTSLCGDGLVLNEECDDGNNLDGDGCSSNCKEESGYTCEQPSVSGEMVVPIIYKDFDASHPDFQPGATGCMSVSKGMVKDTLGPNAQPVLATTSGSCGFVSSSASLTEWYDHSPGQDGIVVSTLTLFDNGNNGYVNRWGENGEQWRGFVNESWCGDSNCSAAGCNACADMCITPCTYGSNACCVTPDPYDGNPFFFPMDGLGTSPSSEYGIAKIGPEYGYDSWPTEENAIAIAQRTVPVGYRYNHNFHFTSEVRFWFQYKSDVRQILAFTGDDDVWVFINNQLAVDLGGIHTPQSGDVDVSTLGLEDGQVYEIVVFQAERQTDGSTYRLTLSGFNTARSECRPKCGDGVVGLGEECDDGVNDGGYGECGEGCRLGEYCGDGIVQKEEDCDDGNFYDDDECPASCRKIRVY